MYLKQLYNTNSDHLTFKMSEQKVATIIFRFGDLSKIETP